MLLGWHMRSINIIMAYTQAKVKTDIFMTLPKGTTIPNVDPSKHLLQLRQNLYGLKDRQVTWHEHIKKGLKERGFMPSKLDPCLFIKGSVLLVLYTENAAFFSPSAQAVDDEIASLKKPFDLNDEGELQYDLGTRFICHTNGQMELQQQKSINNCLNLLGMGKDKEIVELHDTPAESSKILHADSNGTDCTQIWNFRAVVGCLNYLQAMTQPDLSYSVHQCARFCNSPRLSHEQALKHICCYLRGTKHKGLIFKLDLKQGFKCYVDADWAGNWLKSDPTSPAGVLSHSGFLIKYANCPILWGSMMQSLVALSTTEAETIALSTALLEVIHLQNLLQEFWANTFPIPFTKVQIHCRTFEDNAACIEVATSEAKIHPRTEHLAVCLFHF